jgi:hypothetical protein
MIIAFTGEAHPNKFVLQTKLDFRSVETRDHKFISQFLEEFNWGYKFASAGTIWPCFYTNVLGLTQ